MRCQIKYCYRKGRLCAGHVLVCKEHYYDIHLEKQPGHIPVNIPRNVFTE